MSVKIRFWPLVSTLLLFVSLASGLNIPRSLCLSLNLVPGFNPMLRPGEGYIVDWSFCGTTVQVTRLAYSHMAT